MTSTANTPLTSSDYSQYGADSIKQEGIIPNNIVRPSIAATLGVQVHAGLNVFLPYFGVSLPLCTPSIILYTFYVHTACTNPVHTAYVQLPLKTIVWVPNCSVREVQDRNIEALCNNDILIW